MKAQWEDKTACWVPESQLKVDCPSLVLLWFKLNETAVVKTEGESGNQEGEDDREAEERVEDEESHGENKRARESPGSRRPLKRRRFNGEM